MKIIIDISEKIYDTIMSDEMPTKEEMSVVVLSIYQGIPIIEESQTESLISQYQRHNITDKQISDAFQIAIANYWEEKSKYLTAPPSPSSPPSSCCDCQNIGEKKMEHNNEKER